MALSRNKSPITSHVLNQVTGTPAGGITAQLTLSVAEYTGSGKKDRILASFSSESDLDTGRIQAWSWHCGPERLLNELSVMPDLQKDKPIVAELRLSTADYWKAKGVKSFYPEVVVRFEVETNDDGTIKGHYHVPVLLGPWGYTTYRGN